MISIDGVFSAVEGAASQVVGAVTNPIKNVYDALTSSASGILMNASMEALFGNPAQQSGPPYPNILNLYSSYNYIFTLSPLSNNEINYPLSYRNKEPSGIILRSGGSGDLKITGEQENQLGITTDLYIDDVQILTLIGNNPDTKFTTVLNVEFTVTEPYSMGMFLENLTAAAKKKGFDNHISAPYLLTLEFVGWDSQGQLHRVPSTKRFFPIKILDVNFSIDETGSKYNVKGIGWEDTGLTDEVQSVKTDSDLEGQTIAELLQTGPKSLASLLNTREQKLKEDGHKPDADEYVILFPKERSLTSSDSSDDGGATSDGGSDDDFVKQIYGTQDPPNPSGDPDSEKEKILGFELETGTIGDDLRAFAEDESNTNEIGLSKISKGFITQGIPYFGRPAFVENEDQPGMFKRDKITASEDGTRLTFKRGERIQDIIEEVVLLSEYGRQFSSKEENDKGMKTWFRIESDVYVGQSGDGMKKTGDKPKVYVYKVIPYDTHVSKHKAPAKKSTGIQVLKKETIKEYNYIYTGKNDSIIEFDIDMNYAYYAALQSDYTTFSDSRVLNSAQQAVEDDGEEDPEFSTADPEEIAEEGSYVVTQSTGTSTGATGGGSKNHPESRASRNLSDLIMNGVDLIQVDLKIWGDPYYVSDTGIGNYTAEGTNLINLTVDGTMDYQYSEVDIGLNFRTPVDIGPDGLMVFPGTDTKPLYQFSGLYQVLQVRSFFAQGQFTQELKLLRRHHQNELAGGGGKKEAIQENEGGADGAVSPEEKSEMDEMVQDSVGGPVGETNTYTVE